VKIDCIHCRDVGWVRSGPSSRWRECVACGSWKHHPRPDY
jgi:ribosomal protein S27E